MRRSIRMVSSLATNHTASIARRARTQCGMVEQQIVALGDDEARRRQHDERRGERLFQRAVEARHVYRVVDLPLHPLEQMRITGRVERVRGALAAARTDPVELGIGQVEAVHRNVRDPVGALSRPDAGDEHVDEGRFAGSRAARDAKDRARRIAGQRDRIAGKQIRRGHMVSFVVTGAS